MNRAIREILSLRWALNLTPQRRDDICQVAHLRSGSGGGFVYVVVNKNLRYPYGLNRFL